MWDYIWEIIVIFIVQEKNSSNGIGLDILSEDGDKISQAYYRQLRGYGKVVGSYQSGNRA